MIKKTSAFLISAMIAANICFSSLAVAADVVPEAVAQKIKGLLKGFDISEISKFRVPEMYEVVISKTKIVYVHLPTGLVFGGQVYEGADGTNLTVLKGNELTTRFTTNILSTIDKSKAIKIGSGPVEMAQFIEVDSKFSREVMAYLADKDDVFTRYVFLLPLKITNKTVAKTQMILSSKNQIETMQFALKGDYDDKLPEFVVNDITNEQMAYNGSLMERYKLAGTPTQVWSTGFMEGYNKSILDKIVKETREKVKK